MLLKDLLEAPMQDFGAYGDLDSEGSFRPDDLRAIRNPKWVEKVHNAFAKTKENFNIYVYNGEKGRVHFDDVPIKVNDLSNLYAYFGLQDVSTITRIIGKVPENWKNSITILLVENEGAERFVLTPWILAHRIAHILLEDHYGATNVNEIKSLIDQFKYKNFGENASFAQQFINSVSFINGRMKLIGTTRAMRQGNLANPEEITVELLTQFLIQGKCYLKSYEETPTDASIDLEILQKAKDSYGRSSFIKYMAGKSSGSYNDYAAMLQHYGKIYDEYKSKGLLFDTDHINKMNSILIRKLNVEFAELLRHLVGRCLVL